MMSKSDDLYEILQVHHAAESEVIEAAYRRLLRMYHPDVNKTAQAHDITVRLNAAYEVLRDPVKRADYDRQRGSQTEYDRRQWEQEAERERQAHAEQQRREWQSQANRERREREDQAEQERQEYLEWERQAQARARRAQERQELTNLLFQAIRNGDAKLVRSLIDTGVHVNAKDEDGDSPLHKSNLYGDVATTLYLIFNGADVNTIGKYGKTPLHHAWTIQSMQALITAGANVNAKDDLGRTPLHEATVSGAEAAEAASILIANGAKVNARSNTDETPLHRAALFGDVATASTLISNGADVNAIAILDETPLHRATGMGKTEIAMALIYTGADVTAISNLGATPLDIAKERGHTETAVAIEEYMQRQIEKQQRQQIHRLFQAVREGDTNTAVMLIDKGVDVNSTGGSNYTPLHWAVWNGHTEIALALISAGADVNARDNTGRTPEDCAKENSPTVAAIRRLRMEAQAEKARQRQERQVKAKKATQRQTLQMFQAVKEGDVETVMDFIDAGVDVNSTLGGSDYTLLHWAAWKGHTGIALALISAGADLERRVAGDTPLDLAIKGGNFDTVSAIREIGGAL